MYWARNCIAKICSWLPCKLDERRSEYEFPLLKIVGILSDWSLVKPIQKVVCSLHFAVRWWWFVVWFFVTTVWCGAAVYLREYASQGWVDSHIRIALKTFSRRAALIVYCVFGLGFFIDFLGSGIDQAFLPEALPSPTFGTGWFNVGILSQLALR